MAIIHDSGWHPVTIAPPAATKYPRIPFTMHHMRRVADAADRPLTVGDFTFHVARLVAPATAILTGVADAAYIVSQTEVHRRVNDMVAAGELFPMGGWNANGIHNVTWPGRRDSATYYMRPTLWAQLRDAARRAASATPDVFPLHDTAEEERAAIVTRLESFRAHRAEAAHSVGGFAAERSTAELHALDLAIRLARGENLAPVGWRPDRQS